MKRAERARLPGRGAGSGGGGAALGGLEPGEKLQGALGVGQGGPRHEEQVESLTREAEESAEFCLGAAAAEGGDGGGGEFVPERGIGSRAQRRVAEGRAAIALKLAGGGSGGVRGGGEAVGQGGEAMERTNRVRRYGPIVLLGRSLSFIK